MRRPIHFAVAALGLAAAVYGAASLTGGWLGTPPWWERRVVLTHFTDFVMHEPIPGREWISGGLTVGGLGLAAAVLCPRKPLRALLGALGIATAVYGAALLGGGPVFGRGLRRSRSSTSTRIRRRVPWSPTSTVGTSWWRGRSGAGSASPSSPPVSDSQLSPSGPAGRVPTRLLSRTPSS